MKSTGSGTLALAAAALLLLAVAVPASASTVRVNVNTSKQTAEWQSQTVLYVNFTYPETSLVSSALNGTSGSVNLNVTAQSSTSVTATALINGSVASVYQHATVSNLSLYYNATWSANATQLSVEISSALRMSVSGIGNGTAGSVNMSWKDFNFSRSINVSSNVSGSVDINSPSGALVYSKVLNYFATGQKQLSGIHSFDYSAFSKRLSDWKRAYDASRGETSYSYDAGVTLNRTYNLSLSSSVNSHNYILSVYLDPSAQVVTSGNTYAAGNTLYVQQARSSGTLLYIAAGAVIVLLGAGIGAAFIRRRGRKS